MGEAKMAVVETERHGQILVVRMNRPERLNALSFEMRTRLAETWTEFRHDNDLEVAIFTGAVKRLNQITEQLAGVDYAKAPGFLINGLKREELIATNSMILHEVYFGGLGPEESRPGPALAEALARDFGSFDWWRAQFVAMGKAEGGGSGWVILTWDPRDKRLVNAWAADHTTTLAAGQPILVLDMYEHAYQMDYGAKAGDYVEAFMKAIRWANAENLYAQHARS